MGVPRAQDASTLKFKFKFLELKAQPQGGPPDTES